MDQENLEFEEYDECVPVYMPDEKVFTFALLMVFLNGFFSFVFNSTFAKLKAISYKLIFLSIFLLISYVFIIIIIIIIIIYQSRIAVFTSIGLSVGHTSGFRKHAFS